MDVERRQHRRLAIRLPLEWSPLEREGEPAVRSNTFNISTGGLYFETEIADGFASPDVFSLLSVELTVPPGEGHFPYEGRVRSVAEVLRCDPLETADGDARRVGVAARFREPLKLAF